LTHSCCCVSFLAVSMRQFCLSYRHLLHRIRRDGGLDPSLAEQREQIADTFSHAKLVSAVSAVLLEVSRGLQLPIPMLNAVENDMLTRRFKPTSQSISQPSPASVVSLPSLPSITMASSPAHLQPTLRRQQPQRKSPVTARGETIGAGGRLKEARRQLRSVRAAPVPQPAASSPLPSPSPSPR
jgi:hypothetical protein